MKIASSMVGMESARSYQASMTKFERFEIKDYVDAYGMGTSMENNSEDMPREDGRLDTADPIVNFQQRLSSMKSNYRMRSSEENHAARIHQETVKYIFELLFHNRQNKIRELLGEQACTPEVGEGTTQYYEPTKIHLIRENYYSESEETTFRSTGTVVCEDGRRIDFNINIGMSREFESYARENLAMTQAPLCDPLVINLDGNVAEVSDQTFYFDIDADGQTDRINTLKKGSAFLALDKNGDGIINDGSELFGAKSGDGFADLARYDVDHNGWIDENDNVWKDLVVWTKDETGKDVKMSLAEAGVGAICLSRVGTQYSQTDAQNNAKAMIRSTGVFLYENGNVGTVQHLDLAKYEKEA